MRVSEYYASNAEIPYDLDSMNTEHIRKSVEKFSWKSDLFI